MSLLGFRVSGIVKIELAIAPEAFPVLGTIGDDY
jgi:hypothetical protein